MVVQTILPVFMPEIIYKSSSSKKKKKKTHVRNKSTKGHPMMSVALAPGNRETQPLPSEPHALLHPPYHATLHSQMLKKKKKKSSFLLFIHTMG